jgi:hypothetical protein
MVAMETMVATAACRARVNGMLSSCNSGSRSRPVINDEDGIENIVTTERTYFNHGQNIL